MKNHTVTATVGSNVTLPCDTDVPPHPPPTYTWQLLSNPSAEYPLEPTPARIVVRANGHLRIRDVTTRDSGYYQCIVKNGFGESRQLVTLEINNISPSSSPTPTPTPALPSSIPTGN